MADFGPFGAILGYLNDEILQITPFSPSTFHRLSGGTIEIPSLEHFENLRDLY